MRLVSQNVMITVPKWRIAGAHALLFAAWLFGAGNSTAVWSNIGAFIARGSRVEFISG